MTAQGYQVIMADPPWPVGDKRGLTWHGGLPVAVGRARFSAPYAVTTMADMGRLLDAAVFCYRAADHVVFLWATDGVLTGAEGLMQERGYRRYMRFIWDKGNGPMVGPFGIRRTHEYLLWFYRGRLLPVAPSARGRMGSVLEGRRREHSRKPESAYQMVEALYPDARKLDAFSRAYRVGWDACGDQVDHFTPLLAPLREVQA
jgi:N6-adenosine-specific RNA methylase IME4